MTTLRAAVRAYLAMRRDLGFHLHETGRLLLKFVTFMEQHRASVVTTSLALAWAQHAQTVQPAEWARRLSMVRIFARYRHAFDPRTEIPPDGLLPYRPKRARPYLYSDAEIRRLVHAALRTMPYHYQRGALRPVGLHLSVRAPECLGAAPRRRSQPRAARCRSPGRGVDHPRRKVWEDTAGAVASLSPQGARRLPPPTATSLGEPARVVVCVRLQLGASAGWR